MIVPDINLLIYSHNDKSPHHRQARDWWEGLLNGQAPVGLAWVAMSGFIRLMTSPRVMEKPMSAKQATSCVRDWLDVAPVRIIHPGDRFAELFFGYLVSLGVAGNLTTDAQLAAIAVEYQAELHSADTDFHRFPGLRWRNPLCS